MSSVDTIRTVPGAGVAHSRVAAGDGVALRDQRLDFWRGLCLIDMVLVHFVYAGLIFGSVLQPVLAEYLRFAAGGFVLMSGACVGAVFLPKAMDPARRRGVYGALWRRAAYILGIQYAFGASFLLLDVFRGAELAQQSWAELLVGILTGRMGGDLLPMYVAMLALSPALLECLRRGWWKWVLAASFAVFMAGQSRPYLLSPDTDGNFPLLLWQFVFTLGLVGGAFLPKYDALGRGRKAILAGALWAGYGVIFLMAYGWEFGLSISSLGLSFHKVPLTLGELLRYLTLVGGIVMATDLAWPMIRTWRATRYVARLGKYTLAMYVAHVYLQEAIMPLAWKWWWIGAWQILLAVAAIAMLGLMSRWLDRRGSKKAGKPRITWGHMFRGWAAPPAGVSAAAALLLVAVLYRPNPAPSPADRFFPQNATAIDVQLDTSDLPPTDRNHDYYNDLDNDPLLPMTAEA